MASSERRSRLNFANKGISRTEAEHIIDEWIFNERDRKLLKRRHLDGIKFEQLAEEFEMSPRQVQNVIYNLDNWLDVHISCF